MQRILLEWFVYTMANAVTMGFIGRGFQMFGATVNTEYIVTYMLIGSILWGYLSLLFEITAETVAWERWEETIEYTFMAPISRITHLVSMSVYSIIYGIIRSGVILLEGNSGSPYFSGGTVDVLRCLLRGRSATKMDANGSPFFTCNLCFKRHSRSYSRRFRGEEPMAYLLSSTLDGRLLHTSWAVDIS